MLLITTPITSYLSDHISTEHDYRFASFPKRAWLSGGVHKRAARSERSIFHTLNHDNCGLGAIFASATVTCACMSRRMTNIHAYVDERTCLQRANPTWLSAPRNYWRWLMHSGGVRICARRSHVTIDPSPVYTHVHVYRCFACTRPHTRGGSMYACTGWKRKYVCVCERGREKKRGDGETVGDRGWKPPPEWFARVGVGVIKPFVRAPSGRH